MRSMCDADSAHPLTASKESLATARCVSPANGSFMRTDVSVASNYAARKPERAVALFNTPQSHASRALLHVRSR